MSADPEPPARRTPTGPPSALARNVVVGSLAVMVAAGLFADTVLLSQVDRVPVLFIALNARNRNLVLASDYLDPWTFFVVAFVRLVLSDPLFFLLGRWYGDGAVRWIEAKSPTYGGLMRSAERWFAKASYPLVAIAPNNFICLFAGASGMPVAGFLIANVLGTAVRLVVLRIFGNVFDTPLDWIRDLIVEYRTIVLVGGIVAFFLSIALDRRAGGTEAEGLLHIEEQIAEIEARDAASDDGDQAPD